MSYYFRGTVCIKKLVSKDLSIRKIVVYLDRIPSTISRNVKINKGSNGIYNHITLTKCIRKKTEFWESVRYTRLINCIH